MSYCTSRFRTIRRHTREVMVGAVGVGGAHPIRLQSMTTSDTQDIMTTVKQSIALAEVGCEIVRITAPNVTAAKCLKEIRSQFTAAGFGSVPLVADIHFLPSAAMEAVEHVEKIRVNPGNYADKKKFAVREYSDADYDTELARLHEAFSPLVKRCKELGRAMRVGTNHGSLSDRIMNRYGDTPLGMVESALEFLRIAESHSYRDIILSMKASNPKVMIQAYRLLVERMTAEDMHYPLHLGVTEAGDGEDGRIKSAIGIGSLLWDGLGDTIRVSLTEDSVYEIPVARAIADKAMSLWQQGTGNGRQERPQGKPEGDSIDPYHFEKRETPVLAIAEQLVIGPEHPPRVIVRLDSIARLAEAAGQLAVPALIETPAEGLLVPITSPMDLGSLCEVAAKTALPVSFLALELSPTLTPDILQPLLAMSRGRMLLVRKFAAHDGEKLAAFARLVRDHGHFLAVDVAPADLAALADTCRQLGAERMIFTHSGAPSERGSAARIVGASLAEARSAVSRAPASDAPTTESAPIDAGTVFAGRSTPVPHSVGAYRELAEQLHRLELPAPIWIRNTARTAVRGDNSFLSKLLEASILTGALMCDGVGDLVSIETETDCVRATKLAYNVLQGTGARISKTEFVACPSCGRTLFDLQTTTQRIRAQTEHLKGVKLAIMGCIVNGPGEMADADFGYVGGAPGKINLYVGKNCVQYNIPAGEADARLIALIKEHGKWIEPRPVHG